MTLALPSAKVNVGDGGLGLVDTPSTDIHVVMAPSSTGTPLQPFDEASTDSLKTDYGAGPLPKCAGYSVGKTAAPVIAVRLPATSRAAQTNEVTGPTGKTVSITGTPNEGYDIVVVCTLDGTIGSAPGPSFKWSKDGGQNFTSPASLGSGTTLALTGTGLTVHFTSTETYSADDEISAWTVPAAQSFGPVTTTRIASSTCVVTVDGSPIDDAEFRLEVLAGCTVGTAGGAYRYSLDGGQTFTAKLALGTDNTITIKDDREGTINFGATVHLASGTLDAGDVFEWKSFGPAIAAADAITAVDNLLASQHSWRFIHLPTWLSKTSVASVASKLADIAVGDSAKQTFVLASARPRGTYEDETKWEARLLTEWGDFGDSRTGAGAGQARILCPFTKRLDRRTCMFPVVARIVSKTIQVDPGRRLDGPLGTDVQLYDDNKLRVEHDARIRPALHGARFITLRTYYDRPGIYVTRGNLMSAPGSDFNRIAHRAVMDLAATVFKTVMLAQLENHLAVNPAVGGVPGATPGTVRESDLRRIDRELTTALENALVATGYASAVSARCSRTDPFLTTGKLTAEVRITPLGYIDQFEGSISFINPAFAAFQAA